MFENLGIVQSLAARIDGIIIIHGISKGELSTHDVNGKEVTVWSYQRFGPCSFMTDENAERCVENKQRRFRHAANSTTHVAFLDEYETCRLGTPGYWFDRLCTWGQRQNVIATAPVGQRMSVLTSSLRIVIFLTITKDNGRLPRAPRFALLSSFLLFTFIYSYPISSASKNFTLLDSEYKSILQHSTAQRTGGSRSSFIQI